MEKRTGSVSVQHKDWAGTTALIDRGPQFPSYAGQPRFALFNANPFHYGVANLGWQCIAEYLIERQINVFVTFADTLGLNGRAFLNTESLSPLEVDVIGFSVPFEDTYLNVLRMLDSAGLPLLAQDRPDDLPIVVMGGMAMINPAPLEPFADVIVIGEGREALTEIIRRRAAWRVKKIHFNKRDFLGELADIPGVYVPSHYRIELDEAGYVSDFTCLNGRPGVEANVVLDMSQYPIQSTWTSRLACYEYDDYYSLMAAMGCHKKCHFCVVGHIQGARSGRAITIDADQVIDLALARRERYGTNLVKIFFSSAFSPDDGDINSRAIKALLGKLLEHGFNARVGSLNVKQADDELFQLLSRVGQREVTLAPETVEALRPSIGKAYIKDERLVELAQFAGQYGFNINIYSLGCLPGETDQHTRDYARLIQSLRRAMGKTGTLYVHYNPAFMKAQTPYQYFGNARPEAIRRKLALLQKELEDVGGVAFNTIINDPMVYYQPVLALGDYNSSKVLRHLYRQAVVSEADWHRAFHELGLSDSRYFSAKDPYRRLPWEHIEYVAHDKMRSRAQQVANLGPERRLADFGDASDQLTPGADPGP